MLYERELVANLGFCRISDRFVLVKICQIIVYMLIVKFYRNQYFVQVRSKDYIECLKNYCICFSSIGHIHELVPFFVVSIELNLHIYSTKHQYYLNCSVVCYRMFDHHDDISSFKLVFLYLPHFFIILNINLQFARV